jgi:hypothetical protein
MHKSCNKIGWGNNLLLFLYLDEKDMRLVAQQLNMRLIFIFFLFFRQILKHQEAHG